MEKIMIDDTLFIFSKIDFERLYDKRILITGGTGFIGHWLSIVPAGVKVVRLNQLQYEYGEWPKQDWDIIIHLAPPMPIKVIRVAERTGALVFYASSGAIYDANKAEYATGKLLGERQLLDSGLDVRIARMYSFVGPHMRNHFAIINYIVDALSGGPIKIRGDNVVRSYLYAADMAVWLWRIILDGGSRQIYEVGGSLPVTMSELATLVASFFVPHPAVIYDRMFGPDARPLYVPRDLDKAKHFLQVEEWTSLMDGLQKTIAHYADVLSAGYVATYTPWKGLQ
jgi:nucleoside-diphosphate-sugar epimerase